MYLKVHRYNDGVVVSLCDKDLINKKFETRDLQLNITERFYKGDELSKERIIEILKEARNINIVGKNSIKLALEAGIILKENIIKIKNVPHAQVISS